MNIEDRIVYLETKHKELDALIRKQVKNRLPQSTVDRHKRTKLLLKDEIQALRNKIDV